MSLSKLAYLIKKEFISEIRNIYTLIGILLFTGTLVFLVYKTFNTLNGLAWIAMLYITLLFSGINAIAKSFRTSEDTSRIFEYTLFNPQYVILSKLIYNFLFLTFIFILICFGFFFFLGFAIKDFSLFSIGSFGGILGLTGIFTFLSSVSNQNGQKSTVLLSVMALPVTIPIVLLLIKITSVSARLIQDTSVMTDVSMLYGIDLLILGLVITLFNELWKD